MEEESYIKDFILYIIKECKVYSVMGLFHSKLECIQRWKMKLQKDKVKETYTKIKYPLIYDKDDFENNHNHIYILYN